MCSFAVTHWSKRVRMAVSGFTEPLWSWTVEGLREGTRKVNGSQQLSAVNELKSANFGDTQVETPNGTQVTPSFASEHRAQVVRLSEKRRRVSGGHFAHLHQYEGKTILGQGSKFLTCLWRLKSSPTFLKRKPSMDLKVISLNKKSYFRNWLK